MSTTPPIEITWGRNPDEKASVAQHLYDEAMKRPNEWGDIEVDSAGKVNAYRNGLRRLEERNGGGHIAVKSKTVKPEECWLLSFMHYTVTDDGVPTKWAKDNPQDDIVEDPTPEQPHVQPIKPKFKPKE